MMQRMEKPTGPKEEDRRQDTKIGIRPAVGRIFRDHADRSLAVLDVTPEHVLVEYANGKISRVTYRQWADLIHRPASF